MNFINIFIFFYFFFLMLLSVSYLCPFSYHRISPLILVANRISPHFFNNVTFNSSKCGRSSDNKSPFVIFVLNFFLFSFFSFNFLSHHSATYTPYQILNTNVLKGMRGVCLEAGGLSYASRRALLLRKKRLMPLLIKAYACWYAL